MKKYFLPLLLCCSIGNAQRLTSYVDPFLGTGGHGHTYPGATVPFGMVQLSPDNGTEGWDWCSGYHYSSDSIAGFSHTHLSGTGIGDWCDISVLPLTDTNAIRNQLTKIPFRHSNEKATPGFYKVLLGNGVNCSFTTTQRVGYHQYQYAENKAWIQFDMGFRINWDNSTAGMLQLLNDTTLVGYRYSTGWAKNQRVYFAATFSSKVVASTFLHTQKNSLGQYTGIRAKTILQFNLPFKTLFVKVGISSVSTTNALLAIAKEGTYTFEKTAKAAEKLWEKELEKIQINTTNEADKIRFYTALYRTCLAPVVHSDIDNTYRNHQNNIIKIKHGKQYTIFSLWDTFRALHPLFTITQPELLADMINSMLQLKKDNGLLPVWDISTWEANTMTGYHAIPVIADAILKNIKGFDVNKAYEAMLASGYQKQRGTPDYIKYGYLPQDKGGWSVTITLEYAFDDWCIAQVAKKLGKQNDYNLFMQRALNYKNLFDKATGFMRAKDSTGKFLEPFDPLLSEHGFDGQYVEGTAWQHSFFVPHDVAGLAKLYGSKQALINKLDSLFNAPSILHGSNASADVSGLIGQYAHGNEPSHHIIYMYAALGSPQKAAAKIKLVSDSLYKLGPDGLSGNDDCGQMSAWLIWSMIGMYPLNPADGMYVFGYPQVTQTTITLPNQKKLNIKVAKIKKPGQPASIYKVELNGKPMPIDAIGHKDLINGGLLKLYVYE